MTNQPSDRMPKTVPDVTQDQIERLRAIFPECVTEGQVDFDRLRATLGDAGALAGDAAYTFTWAGKADAFRAIQEPSGASLAPAPEESVNWDETEHLFIEGENLEVLKLLYKSYFGRVKMIYIDPPYNTGNDFIYRDDYSEPRRAYLEKTGQMDAEGNVLTTNPETSGRYHSDWLSMMYPRLFLARQLLREDGVIFVSIDDHEVHHLRLLMNEVFGEEQFIGAFIWKSRHNVDSRNTTGFSRDHEYVLAYGRRIQGRGIDKSKYSNPDDDPRGPWMSDNLVGLASRRCTQKPVPVGIVMFDLLWET
jgi:adenine-specific DNA-methyltransferase